MDPSKLAQKDKILLEAFINEGSEPAFSEIIEKYSPLVWAVCERILKNPDDAEDAVQAVFIVLFRNAQKLNTNRPLAGWLHCVARRIAIDLYRQKRTRLKLAADSKSHESPAMSPSKAQLADEQLQTIEQAIDELPEKYRLPVILHYLQGIPQSQVAETLNLKLSTLSMRLTRARDALRGIALKHGYVVTPAAMVQLLVIQFNSSFSVPLATLQKLNDLKVLYRDSAAVADTSRQTIRKLVENEQKNYSGHKFSPLALFIASCGLVTISAVLYYVFQSKFTGDAQSKLNSAKISHIASNALNGTLIIQKSWDLDAIAEGRSPIESMQHDHRVMPGTTIETANKLLAILKDRDANAPSYILLPKSSIAVTRDNEIELLHGTLDLHNANDDNSIVQTIVHNHRIGISKGFIRLHQRGNMTALTIYSGELSVRTPAGAALLLTGEVSKLIRLSENHTLLIQKFDFNNYKLQQIDHTFTYTNPKDFGSWEMRSDIEVFPANTDSAIILKNSKSIMPNYSAQAEVPEPPIMSKIFDYDAKTQTIVVSIVGGLINNNNKRDYLEFTIWLGDLIDSISIGNIAKQQLPENKVLIMTFPALAVSTDNTFIGDVIFYNCNKNRIFGKKYHLTILHEHEFRLGINQKDSTPIELLVANIQVNIGRNDIASEE